MRFKKEIGSLLIPHDDDIFIDIGVTRKERDREKRETEALEKETEEAGGIQYTDKYLKELKKKGILNDG